MHRYYFLFLIILAVLSGDVCAQTINPGEQLGLAQAIEIGLKNQPTILAGLSTVKTSEAKIGELRAGFYPQIGLSETYNRQGYSSGSGTRTTTTTASTTTTSSSTAGPINQYVSSASLSQLIYDFGKTTSQVKAQAFSADSARSDLQSTMNLVAFNVKQAYFNLLQAVEVRDAAKGAVNQFEEHLKQARGFFEVGTKPKFDVTKAEVDLSNAQLALIKAENQVKLGFVTLNNAMGIPTVTLYTLRDKLLFTAFELPFEKALEKAYDQNADLRSILAKKEAAGETIKYYEKGYYPVVAGNAGFSYTGTGFPLDHGWNMGVSLTFPLFSGFQTKYQVAGARSARETVRANELSLRQDILLQVRQAYLNLQEARERIGTTELIIKQATENLELANGRYQVGVGNPIEITDSVVALANAQVSYASALYDYKVSAATIEKIIGVR